jgi:hypothetical protein
MANLAKKEKPDLAGNEVGRDLTSRAEDALKALRTTKDEAVRRRAADLLEQALRDIRQQLEFDRLHNKGNVQGR